MCWIVSILSQPEGRELRSLGLIFQEYFLFQSSPSPKAGSYTNRSGSSHSMHRFQSSPSPKAGSYDSRGGDGSNG